jgi:hypothetical protein
VSSTQLLSGELVSLTPVKNIFGNWLQREKKIYKLSALGAGVEQLYNINLLALFLKQSFEVSLSVD